MARVPGLTPTQREGQQFSRPIRARAGAPDAGSLKPAALQPQAQPVDTYSRPERPPETNTLLQLAETLGAINPALQKFAAVMQPKPEDSYAAARAYLQQTPHADVMTALKSGQTPEPLKNLEGMRVLGEDLAYRDAQAFIEKYNTDFDKTNGDTDALWNEVAGETYKRFGKDRAFMEVYTKAAEDARRKVMTSNMDYKAQEHQTAIADTNFGAWEGRATAMIDKGDDPKDIAASLFGDIEKNKQFLQLHPKDQQKQLLDIADRLATRGQFDVARALLSHERQNGAYKGSLLTDRELGGKATDLIARINKDELEFQSEAAAKAAEEGVYQNAMNAAKIGAVNSIVDQTYKDKKGEDKVVTAETQRKEIARRMTAEIDAEVRRRGGDATLAQKLTKEKFIGNGLEHPQWFQTMKNAAGQLSLNALSKDGNIPPNALDAYQLYKELNAEAPQYLGKYLDQKSIDFFDAARVVEENGDADSPEMALQSAQRVTMDLNEQPEALKFKYESIDSAVTEAGNDGFLWNSEFGNKSYARGEIVKTARVFARSGLDTDDALEKATETFKKTHINVAGTWLKNDKRLPGDFADLSQQYLDEVAKKFADQLNIDADDITLDRYGNGTGSWIVLWRGTRQPLNIPTDDRIITLKSLETLRNANHKKVEDEVIKNQNKR